MPELPEVETIRRGLNKFILHLRITNVDILCDKSFVGPKGAVVGQEIIAVKRRGKALLLELKNGITMFIHLRMTGQLIYRAAGKEDGTTIENTELMTGDTFAGGHPSDSFFEKLPNKQTRVIFEFSDGSHLFFNDQRKFGFIKPVPTAEIDDDPFIKKLADEPWEMDLETFKAHLYRHRFSSIKPTILNQSVIAGVGNIYADEALYDAKIHPDRGCCNLTDKQIEDLLISIRKVMDASLESGGSTMATYVRADGTKGDYLEKFAQVFHREGQPCNRCGHKIIKIRVGGRGTHLCPHCQEPEEDD